MARILLLFAHPAFERSRVNGRLLAGVRDLPDVTLHDLYEAYPDFDIDVGREQTLLAEHDAVVCQHPFFWYSTPALVKQWEDLVLEHGWAYGSGGTALRGKLWLTVVTTGGGAAAYQRDGLNRFTVRELLAPLEQTARLCGMQFLPPFVVSGTHRIDEAALERAASDFRRVLEAVRDGRLDLEQASRAAHLNDHLDTIIRS